MPRGSKTCKHCGDTTQGPRSWNCSVCGKGFIINGVQKPDIIPGEVNKKEEINDTKTGEIDRDERRRLMGLVHKSTDAHEIRTRTKFYGQNSQTYDSNCGHYRIRFGPTFMGVELSLDDNRCYKLFRKRGGNWEMVPEKNRFKKLWVAVKRMEKFQLGTAEPVKVAVVRKTRKQTARKTF